MKKSSMWVIAFLSGLSSAAAQAQLATMFTYQGQLRQDGQPFDGSADFRCTLFDAANAGTPVGSSIEIAAVDVTDGLFTIELDFGAESFDGSPVWLEIEIASPSGGAFMILSPRQAITAAPYSIQTRGLFVDDDGNAAVGGSFSAAGIRLPGAFGPDPAYVGEPGNFLAFGHAGASEDFLGYGNNTFYFKDSPDGGDVGQPNVVVGGSLGISTDTPVAPLDVLGSNDINGTAWFSSPKGPFDSHIHYGATGDWYLRSADSAGNVILQDTGGNVGIGTNAPNAKLDVYGSARINDFDLSLRGGTDTLHGLGWHGVGKLFADTNVDGPVLYGFNGGALGSKQEGAQNIALVWRGNGNVGIGVTAPAAKLHIAGTPGVDGIMFPDGTLQTTAAASGGSAWSLSGNSGTDPATQFLGTTDNQPLTLRVNNQKALRLQFAAYVDPSTNMTHSSNNVVGGFRANSVDEGAVAATIAGGGVQVQASEYPNRVTDNGGTVGGGVSNTAGNSSGTLEDAFYATVSGGLLNTAGGEYTTVGGGFINSATGSQSTVAGGTQNNSSGLYSTVGGGYANSANNQASTVAGGESNAAGALYSTVGGGHNNTATHDRSTVSGGASNQATASGATVSGGKTNLAMGDTATVTGGQQNIASAFVSTVAGGYQNTAAGVNSFAAGRRAKANHDGTFVWADLFSQDFASTGSNQFLILANGGVGINTNTPAGFALNVAGTLSCTTLTQTSDARFKTNVADIDDALDTIHELRGVTFDWNCDAAEMRGFTDGRQIGFVAQEVEKVLPQLVTTDTNGYKSVAYANVVPVLVEAVKSQQAQIDALTALVQQMATQK